MGFVYALVSGIVFGAGLAVAGMTNPQKVLNFLDVAAIGSGGWDPTLLAVFAGALPVMFIAYRLQAGRTAAWTGDAFRIPTRREIDAPLVAGSALFGIGWGLVGLCPGPAVTALALASRSGLGPALLFFASMLAGVWLAHVTRLSATAHDQPAV
jgi:hypothetical protein